MVDPEDVEPILSDAARLIGSGEIVVFGSASLAFRLPDAPASRGVDVWCNPSEKNDLVIAMMGEESWYHRRHGAYVEAWAKETFAAPFTWRRRAMERNHLGRSEVRLVVAHPHDILMSKLERGEAQDWDHARRILARIPLDPGELDDVADAMPHRTGDITDPERFARFEANLASLRRRLGL